MTPEMLDRLRQEILEDSYDCHPDPEGLHAPLAADPELQALADEVRAFATGLSDRRARCHLRTRFPRAARRTRSRRSG